MPYLMIKDLTIRYLTTSLVLNNWAQTLLSSAQAFSMINDLVCACTRACVRACVRARVRECVRVCVCVCVCGSN